MFKKYLSSLLFAFIVLIAFCLRFYNISDNPPGLYMDEVSLGYNAHTILTKGVDEYGTPYPLAFKTFGDYKMPMYIYLTAISEYFFGENEFAVRFPSAILGLFTVVLFYFLIKEIIYSAKLQKDKLYRHLPMVSMFLLAVSPWHIQFSRGGFEVNVALFFYVVALYCVNRYNQTKIFSYLLGGAFFFVLTVYTYFIFRVLTPITMLILVIAFLKTNKINWKQLVMLFVFVLLLVAPTLLFSFSDQGMARFSQTSTFNEYQITKTVDKLYMYPMIYLKNYLSYFSLPYLFATGDGIGRHQVPWFGTVPLWQLPFLLSGIYLLFRKKNLLTFGVLGLFLVSPLAAALAVPSPHTLRNLTMVLPITVLISIGLIGFFQWRSKFIRWLIIGMLCIASIESVNYLHFYYMHYPRVNALDWGSAYKQIVQEASKQKHNYAAILIDSRLGYAKQYFQFYDESLTPIIITDTWERPKNLEGKKLLFIRPNGIASGGKLIKNIYFPYRAHKDIFAQFWEI